MTNSRFDFPTSPWTLSAPESQVLLTGPETDDAWALKLALAELLVRKRYRLVASRERRSTFWSRATNVLVHGIFLGPSAPNPLHAVVQIAPNARTFLDGTVGVSVVDLARSVFARYRQQKSIRVNGRQMCWTRGSYVQAEVLPSLHARGLYTTEAYTHLKVFHRNRWIVTGAGIDALAELRSLLAFAQGPFRQLIADDPDRAQAFVEHAGASLALLGDPSQGLEVLQRRLGDTPSRPPIDRDETTRLHPAGRPGDKVWAASTVPLSLFAVSDWCGVFGPGPRDGFGVAVYWVGVDVDQAYKEIASSGGE